MPPPGVSANQPPPSPLPENASDEESLQKSTETSNNKKEKTCWYKFRRSKVLVILIVFIAMMLDLMLITSVEPILPPLVYDVMQPNATERFLANAFLFQRPEDERQIEMVAASKRKEQKVTFAARWSPDHNMTGSHLPDPRGSHFVHKHRGNGSSSTIVTPYNGNGSDLFDDDYYNETDTFTDPYLVYALEISTLFSLKPAAEIFSNIVSGLIVNRYGHQNPLIIGCMSTFVATLGFAFSPWYWLLAVTRVVQAVGSSLSVVAGLALLTTVFTDEAERNKANSLAYDGLTLGLLLGMPFGSTLYNFSGRQTPFLILAFLVLVDLLLRCLYIDSDDKAPPPHANRSATDCLRETRSIYCSLLSNADVVVALLCSLLINGALGALMATSPAFILDKYNAEQWEIGVILVCGAAAQLSTQTFAGFVLANIVRPWILLLVGFVLYGIGLIVYTHPPTLWLVIVPECIGRVGLGLFTCVITPLLARIVDVCFQDAANYGAIFGLYVASYNLGLAVGPLISASLMDALGPTVTYWVIGCVMVLASLLSLRFRRPLVPKAVSPIKIMPSKTNDERRRLISKSCERPNYTSTPTGEVRAGRSMSVVVGGITVEGVAVAANSYRHPTPANILV